MVRDMPTNQRRDFNQRLRQELVRLGWIPVAPEAAVLQAPPARPTSQTSPVSKVEHPPPAVAAPPAPRSDEVPVPGKSYAYYASDEGKFPTFPVDVVLPAHTFLRAYYDAVDHDQSPSEFGLPCGLVVLSVAIGRSTCFRTPKRVWGNIALCLTGPTSVGKTTALRYATSLIQQTMPFDLSDPESGVHYIPNPGSGESLVDEFMMGVPDPSDPHAGDPKKRRPFKAFYKIKGVVEIPEMSSFAQKATARASTLRERTMDFIDSSDVIGARSLSNRSMARDAFATIVSTTQNGAISDMFGERELVNGFLNRFWFSSGRRKVRRAFLALDVDLTAAAEELRRVRDWLSSTPGAEVTFSDEGRDAWEALFETRVRPLQDKFEDSGLLARLDLMLMRLMFLFAVDDKSWTVERRHVMQAAALIDYLVGCNTTLAKDLSSTSATRAERRVKDFMHRYQDDPASDPRGAKIRDIVRGVGTAMTTAQVATIVRSLVEAGDAEEFEVHPAGGSYRGGRPTSRYLLLL